MERLEIFPLKVTGDLALIRFLGLPRGEASTRVLFHYLSHAGIRTVFLTEGAAEEEGRNLVVAIGEGELAQCQADLESLQLAMLAETVAVERPVAVIRILGPHFDIRPGVAGLLFSTLMKAGIRLLASATTITTTLLAVPEEQAQRAIRLLEGIFKLPSSK